MTHDSIGLGEDGPTHQPVEHLAALRAMPNLNVYRPADGVETAECWELALFERVAPSVLALTRQPVPPVRASAAPENLCARGAYVLRESPRERDITLLATGSEVHLAVAASELLADRGIAAAVVSMPCWELFRKQPELYRSEVLGNAPRVGIEAAVAQGWCEWLGPGEPFIGMTSFGASAPAAQLVERFGLTVEAAVSAAHRVAHRRTN
jgi:transketolase